MAFCIAVSLNLAFLNIFHSFVSSSLEEGWIERNIVEVDASSIPLSVLEHTSAIPAYIYVVSQSEEC